MLYISNKCSSLLYYDNNRVTKKILLGILMLFTEK